jgi:hypothetical protein
VAVLANADLVNGNTGIRIIGGKIDGNRPNATGSGPAFMFGIRFEKVTNFLIEDVRIFDTERDGINVRTSSHGNINNIDLENTGNHGILVGFSSSYINISNITSNAPGTEHVLTEWTEGGGTEEAGWNHHISISNVVGRDAGNHGVAVFHAYQVTVDNVAVYNTSSAGLNVNTAREVTISNSVVDTSANVVAVFTTGAKQVTFNGVISRNSGGGTSAAFSLSGEDIILANSLGIDAARPVHMGSGYRNLVITDNIFARMGDTSLFVVAGDDILIARNTWAEMTATPSRLIHIDDAATGVRILDNNVDHPASIEVIGGPGLATAEVRGNKGFVTANSGTATIPSASTSVTVSHGLSVTPAAGDCTFVGAEDPTNSVGTTWIDTYTSTQMTLNVENDPGASNYDVSWNCSIY